MSLIFDGVDDYATFMIRSGGLLQTTAFSIAFTYRTPSVIPSVDQMIVQIGYSGQTSNSQDTGGAVLIRADGTFGAHSYYGLERKLNTTVVAQPNTTYRFVLMKSTGTNAKLYINAVSPVYSYSVFSTNKLGDMLVVGGRYKYDTSQTTFAAGTVTRLAYWQEQLSTNDVTYVLTDGNLPTGASVPPAEYWPLGNQRYSAFLAGNPATLINDPVFTTDTLSSATVPVITEVGTNYEVQLNSIVNITVNGMANATSATLFGQTLSNFSGSGTTYSVRIPNLVDEVVSPIGQSLIYLNNGSATTTATINVLPPSGHAFVELTSGFQTGSNSLIYNWNPSASVGDIIVYPTLDNTSVDSSGILQTDHEGSQILWHIQKSTGIARSFTVITGSNTISINLLSLLPNSRSPLFDGAFILGDRP